MDTIEHTKLELISSPSAEEIGKNILISNMIETVITDECVYGSWDVYYGICHAFVMIATHQEEKDYWKELRAHFWRKQSKLNKINQ